MHGAAVRNLEATVQLVNDAFRPGELNLTGEHIHAVGFEAVPKPVAAGSRRDGRAGPTLMIGGGARRVLGIAGRSADIVSLNFDNSSGKLGPAGIGSSTAAMTAVKIGWIRDGAGARFDDVEPEIGAYFTETTDDRDAALGRFGVARGLDPEAVADHPHALIGSLDSICDLLVERRERYGISYVTAGKANLEAFAPAVARLHGT